MQRLDTSDKTIFGFWVYLMTDLIMFACLFATFAVLRESTFGGPSGREIFRLPFVLVETMILLTSSLTCGFAVLAARRSEKSGTIGWFMVTFLLGAAFLAMELTEFSHLIADGNTPQKSASLSSFFTLVGTHGLHIAVGLLWILVSIIMVWRRGITAAVANKLVRLGLFWHFLDVVWIFIFTIVYLMGVAK